MSYQQLWLYALAGLVACHSTGTSPQPSPAAEATPTDPAPAGVVAVARDTPDDSRPHVEHGKACAAGSIVVADAGVCLRLPPDYVAVPRVPGVQTFEAPGAPPITVRWQPTTAAFAKTHADAVARLAQLDTAALTDRTRDGAGTFVYAVETQALSHRVAHSASTLQSGDTLAWCSASAPLHGNLPRAFFEACQTMMKRDETSAQRQAAEGQ